jgi:hypothetical protein
MTEPPLIKSCLMTIPSLIPMLMLLKVKFSIVTWLRLITLIMLLEVRKLNQILKHPCNSYLEEHERRKVSKL